MTEDLPVSGSVIRDHHDMPIVKTTRSSDGRRDVVIIRPRINDEFVVQRGLLDRTAEMVASEIRGALADAFHAGAHEAHARADRGARA